MIRSFLMLLLLLAITFAMIAISRCYGGEVRMEWKQSDNAWPVTQWHVYRAHPEPRIQIGVTDQPHIYVEANEGDRLVITAENVAGESDDSAQWVVRFTPQNPVARVTVQTSADMVTWEDHQAFHFDEPKGKFFRLKIEKP